MDTMVQPLQLALAERMKSVRDRACLTQTEAAKEAGIVLSTYFLAEAYGRVGLRARRKIEAWLSRKERSLVRQTTA